MERVILNYRGGEIRMQAVDSRIQMINVMDVAKILQIDGFAAIRGREIENFIRIVEQGWELHYGKKEPDAIINIESSTEIYIHELVFSKLTYDAHPEIHSWFESQQYLQTTTESQ